MTVHFPKYIVGRKIRVGLIGCGRISQKHLFSIFSNHSRCELMALCDVDQNRLTESLKHINTLASEFSVSIPSISQYSDYNLLLYDVINGSLDLDIVVLTTPSGLHSSQTIMAAEAGLHVCTEKPMATRWRDGQMMVRACDKAQVNLFVVKQNRFNKTIQLVKNQFLNARFGRLHMVSSQCFWQRPQSYYDQAFGEAPGSLMAVH